MYILYLALSHKEHSLFDLFPFAVTAIAHSYVYLAVSPALSLCFSVTRSRTRFGGHVEVFAVLLASRPSRACLSLCPAVCGFCHTHLRRRLSRQFQRNCISPGSAGTHALSSKVPNCPFCCTHVQSHFIPIPFRTSKGKRERKRGESD